MVTKEVTVTRVLVKCAAAVSMGHGVMKCAAGMGIYVCVTAMFVCLGLTDDYVTFV